MSVSTCYTKRGNNRGRALPGDTGPRKMRDRSGKAAGASCEDHGAPKKQGAVAGQVGPLQWEGRQHLRTSPYLSLIHI